MRTAMLAGGTLILILTGSGGSPEPASLSSPGWREVTPGISFARVRPVGDEVLPALAVVRVDPSRCRIAPYHEREFRETANVTAWRTRLDAPVVFNAGLYDDSRTHLGTLKRDGKDLGGIHHHRWKGALVADLAPEPGAVLLDLATNKDRSRFADYPTVIQTMTLFDRDGTIRVRKTERSAARTVVADDGRGWLYVVVTEGHYTLWNLAELLKRSGWELGMAIALDGGSESNLEVQGGGVAYRSSLAADDSGENFLRGIRSLPAVIAISSRDPG